MFNEDRRRKVDMLVEQFWKNGYLTLSRKFGTYLPEPKKLGQFEVDIIARYKKDYAIGICIAEEDIDSENFNSKISFLATRQTKTSNKRVLLFIGVPEELLKEAKHLLESLDPLIRKHIKLFPIADKQLPAIQEKRKRYIS